MIIVDSSVAFKWFSEEEQDVQKAFELLSSHLGNEKIITVPELIFYELTNSWSTKSRLTIKDVLDNIKLLKRYNLKVNSVSFGLLNKASKFSKKYQVSVYDAIYAVLAKENKCDLITADEKFANKVNLNFIKKLSEI